MPIIVGTIYGYLNVIFKDIKATGVIKVTAILRGEVSGVRKLNLYPW